jgi:hypothetical protein
MRTSETIAKLRELSDEELVRRHDDHAAQTVVGTAHYLTELGRRDQQRATDTMLRYTRAITWMTVVITIATIVSATLVAITILR